jgi:hypothetical protein
MLVVMGTSMVSGILTSVSLETVVLKVKESLSWKKSLQTALTMSTISMLTMELAENIVDFHLTQGIVDYGNIYFWLSLIPSLVAGFIAPLPYNYYQLKKYGKSCH